MPRLPGQDLFPGLHHPTGFSQAPQIPIITMMTERECYMLHICYVVESLAELLPGMATLASFLFGQVT